MGKTIQELKDNRLFSDIKEYEDKLTQWKNKNGDYSKFEFSGESSYPIYIFGWANWRNLKEDASNISHVRNGIMLKDLRSDNNIKKIVYSFGGSDTWGDEGHAYSKVYFGGDHTYNRNSYTNIEYNVNGLSDSKYRLNHYISGGRGRKGTDHQEWTLTKPDSVIKQEVQDYKDTEPVLDRLQYCKSADTVMTDHCRDWCKDNKNTCDQGMEQYCSANPLDLDYCGCFNFDESTKKVMEQASAQGISLLPQCNVKKCMTTGYQTQNMLDRRECPSVQLCIQSVDVGDSDLALFEGVNFNCNQESETVTAPASATPVSASASRPYKDEQVNTEEEGEEREGDKIAGLDSTTFYIIIAAASCCCCILLLLIIYFSSR